MSTPSTLASAREYFCRELAGAGWHEEKRGSGTAFTRERCMIVLPSHDGSALLWNVLPTAPRLPAGVFTKSTPAPVAMFAIQEGGLALHVALRTIERTGRFVEEAFFAGDLAGVFRRLLDESVQRVDTFVRTVEQT